MKQTLWTSSEGHAFAFLASSLFLFSVSLLFLRLRHPKLKLPPSPFPSLPLLGHVFHLRNVGRTASLHSLRSTLGPIFSLHVGRTPLIYITSASLAHEALVANGVLFAARPVSRSRAIFTNNFRSITTSSYGPHWRAMRRNLVQEMLAVPKILSFRPVRFQTLDDMISDMLTEAQHNKGVVSVFASIRAAMFQLLIFMCFGFHMPKDILLEISDMTDELLSLAGGNLEDFYSFLRFFNGKKWQKAYALRAKQVQLYTALIEKHQKLQKLGELSPGSYLETLLRMDASTALSVDDLVTLCSEFTAAGTDTTVTTLEWVVARLVENPSIQSKLYNEIHDVVGDKPVEEKDVQNLPYLQAVVKETLRLHPPGHFLLPHSTSKLCTVGGYDIPPNAIVMFDVMSIAKDPEIWEEPLRFKPERFFTSNVDITGSKELTMMPFGAGRRICPGLVLAFMHMELFVARLVQAFEWSIFPSGAEVDFTERVVFTVRMQYPLKAFVKQRRGH